MMNSNDSLNLQAWQAEVTPPARFQSEVWQKIAARTPARRNVVEGWLDSLLLLLPRPVYATALLAVSIGLGVGLGHVAADNHREVTSQEGQALYVASINPLSHSATSFE